jgi:hypothetical protein
MLPKTMLRNNIVNPSTEEAIKIYQADKNYLNFYRNFLIELGGRVLVKSQYGTVACLSPYSRQPTGIFMHISTRR